MSTRLVFLSVAMALEASLLRFPVYAQTPTPTPIRVEVAGDIVDARYNLSFLKSGLINITQGIPGVGDQLAEWASQFWTTVFKHDLPDLDDKANWLKSSNPGLTPKSIKDVTVDFTTEQQKTYTSRLCIPSVNGSQAREEVSNRRIYSETVPWVNPLVQYGERFNSFIGRYRRGDQDYDRPSQIVRLDSARPCDTADSALDLREITFDAQDINQYGTGANAPLITTAFNPLNFVVGRLEELIDGILNIFLQWNTSALVAWILPTERMPWAEQDCHIFGCESGDLSRAPLDDTQKEELTDSKGFVLTYKPKVLSYRTNINGNMPNSFTTNTGTTQTIETHTYMTKGVQDSLVYLKCSLLPKEKQVDSMGTDYEDTECKYQAAASCGDRELPDLSGTDASCGLCNTDGIADFIASVNPDYANQLPEGNLPQVAIDVLNKAASTYNVPAPVLLGAMIQEGAFTWDDWQWTGENVMCWSVEGGKIGQTTFGDDASCMSHAHPATGSRGAFGWIDTRFAPYSDAVRSVDPGRAELDQCNFLDAAFAAAKSMSDTQGGGPSTPASCNGITLLQNAGRRNCSAWDDSRAGTAQYTYNGSCTAAVPRTVNAFRQFKCF